MPLAALLFLFFPRLPGAFWALPGDGDAITGLGDEMTPGDIARLVESDEPALRVRFSGALPPVQERYWRGPVLHDFDGMTWRRRRGAAGSSDALKPRGPGYHYSASIEPNNHGTVIALEMSEPPNAPNVTLTDDFQLLLRKSPTQTQATSSRPTRTPNARRSWRRCHARWTLHCRPIATHGPVNWPPACDQAADDGAYVAAVLAYFRTGGFEYTLTPHRLGRDAVDDLLFSTREGFCGHFASAFVDLMRAGGVPARVVTGYQGGEWNPIGHYLTVRQSDAHAWAEVWLPGKGWLRADPTAAVSPDRLNREWLAFEGADARSGAGLAGSRWLAALLQSWDALSAWWQDDVVGFDVTRQLKLADWLGFGDRDWKTLAVALGAGMGVWLLWIGWTLRRIAASTRPDGLARAWRAIDRRLARAGYARAANEAVSSYCQRLARSNPALAAALVPLAHQYVQLRYGPPSEAGEWLEFARAARRFRPRAR